MIPVAVLLLKTVDLEMSAITVHVERVFKP